MQEWSTPRLWAQGCARMCRMCKKWHNDAHPTEQEREDPKEAPLCASDRVQGLYMGGYPIAIRSLITIRREDQNNSAQTLLQTVTGITPGRGRGPLTHGFLRSEPGGSSPCTSAGRVCAAVTSTLRSASWCIRGAGLSHPWERLYESRTYPGGMVGGAPCPASSLFPVSLLSMPFVRPRIPHLSTL